MFFLFLWVVVERKEVGGIRKVFSFLIDLSFDVVEELEVWGSSNIYKRRLRILFKEFYLCFYCNE